MNKKYQNKKVGEMYSSISEIYDDEFAAKANYQIPKILRDLYKKYNIQKGSILDLGCGTGNLKNFLGENFSYTGIDLSKSMLEKAEGKGYSIIKGDFLDSLKKLEDRSFDHVVALSSLYFSNDYEEIIKEIERITKKSYFLSLEQYREETKEIMRKREIELFNHDKNLIQDPTEILENIFLWERPNTGDKIYGDIVFKTL